MEREVDCKWNFSENGPFIVLNAQKIKESKEIHIKNTHMDHETSPFLT